MTQRDDTTSARNQARNRVCAYCATRCPPGVTQAALVDDSSVIDPTGPGADGRRYVAACCGEHLQLLIDQARDAWVSEQLWFGQLCRASTSPGMHGATLDTIATHARLSPDQLRRATDWNADGDDPRSRLPGEQPLPTA